MAGENNGVKDEVQSGRGGGCSEDDDLGSLERGLRRKVGVGT